MGGSSTESRGCSLEGDVSHKRAKQLCLRLEYRAKVVVAEDDEDIALGRLVHEALQTYPCRLRSVLLQGGPNCTPRSRLKK